MKTSQKQSLITLLSGILAGSVITALITSSARMDDTWEDAWARSSNPIDLSLDKRHE